MPTLTFASSSRLLMVPEDPRKAVAPEYCAFQLHLMSIAAGPGPAQVETGTARLLPGISNGPQLITTPVSAIAKTYFILTWSKVSKHKQFLLLQGLSLGRREEKHEKESFSALPKEPPNSVLAGTPLLHLPTFAQGDGGKSKLGEGAKAKSGTALPRTHAD